MLAKHMSAKQTTTRQTPKRNIETESQEKRTNIFFNLERIFQTGNGTMKYIFYVEMIFEHVFDQFKCI